MCQRGDRTVAQVARDFDLTETAVRSWVKRVTCYDPRLDAAAPPPGAPAGSGFPTPRPAATRTGPAAIGAGGAGMAMRERPRGVYHLADGVTGTVTEITGAGFGVCRAGEIVSDDPEASTSFEVPSFPASAS